MTNGTIIIVLDTYTYPYNNQVYIAGYTNDSTLPTTSGSYQTNSNGYETAFIAKFDLGNTGSSSLVYSTFLHGTYNSNASGIAIDSYDNVYVTGYNTSTDFPTTTGAYQTNYNGTGAFVTKLNYSLSNLTYSTLLGGGNANSGQAITLDKGGNIYIAGYAGINYPNTSNTTVGSGSYVAITKIKANGSAIIFATFLDTSNTLIGDSTKIAVDSNGNAFISGWTFDTNFPTTSNAYQVFCYNSAMAFVTGINANGNGLTYSSCFGDNHSNAYPLSLAMDAANNVYVTGYTYSSGTDFPITPGAYQTTNNGGIDAFVMKINPAVSGKASLVYSTFLGGSNSDSGSAIAVDSKGNAFVAGNTASTDFPTTTGTYQPTYGDGTNYDNEIFVTELNALGSQRIYSTYVVKSGVACNCYAYNMAVDNQDNVYVVGQTNNNNFPTTNGAYQTSSGGGEDGIVFKLNAAGSSLIYSTYIGGSKDDYAVSIAVDNDGLAYVALDASSSNIPTTPGAYQPISDNTKYSGEDVYIAKLKADGSGLVYGTYFGGSSDDVAVDIVIDNYGNVYICGNSGSFDLPTTSGSYQANYTGYSVFVSELSLTNLSFTTQPSGATGGTAFTNQPVVKLLNTDGSVFSGFNGAVTLSLKANTGTAGAALGGTTTVNAVNGVATFTNLAIDKVGTGYVLTASAPGLANTVDSQPFNVAIGNPATLTVVAGSNQSANVNAAFGTALQVKVSDAGNNPIANIGVTFTAPSSGASGNFAVGGATTIANTDASGTATASTFTANNTPGSYNVTVSVAGLTATFSLTNNGTTTPPSGGGSSGYTYNLPFLANAAGGFTSYLAFQNFGNGTAHFTLQYFNSDGSSLTGPALTGSCANLVTAAECIAPNPFSSGGKGAGIISSDQPLNVIVAEATPYGGSAYAVTQGSSSSLIDPLALNGAFSGFITQLLIFNGGNSAAQVTVNFYDSNGTPQASATQTISIAPDTTKIIDQTAGSLPSGFNGWAQISSSNNATLSAQVIEQNPANHFVAIANCQSNPTTTLYAPAIFHNGYGSFNTGANIVNPNNNAVTVNITYYDDSGKATTTAPFTLNSHAIVSIYQGASSSGNGLPTNGLPDTWVGSAKVTATSGNIAMVVNESGGLTATGSAESGTYAAAAQGGATTTIDTSAQGGPVLNNVSAVGLPVMAFNGFGYNTGATVLNINNDPAGIGIKIDYFDTSGKFVTEQTFNQVLPFASQPIAQGLTSSGLSSGFYGTAIVSENAGPPGNNIIITTNALSSAFFYTYTEPNS